MKPGKDFIGLGIGAFIFNDRNEFLMVLRGENCKNEAGMWMLPGGAVDFNERLQDTVKREIKEELGIDVEVDELVGVINHILPEEKQHWVSNIFKCKIVSGEPRIQEPHKHAGMKWFSLDSLPENLSIASALSIKEFMNLKK